MKYGMRFTEGFNYSHNPEEEKIAYRKNFELQVKYDSNLEQNDQYIDFEDDMLEKLGVIEDLLEKYDIDSPEKLEEALKYASQRTK